MGYIILYVIFQKGDQVLKIQFPDELKKSESLENLLPKVFDIFIKFQDQHIGIDIVSTCTSVYS